MTTILFFGTPQFSVPTLELLSSTPGLRVAAVITQPDRPTGRGGAITSPPVKTSALLRSIPVFQPSSLKKEFSTLQPSLEALGPFDIGVVIAFGQLLPPEVLSFPRAGCVNIHASLLPRWRGAAPIQRAIEAGDSETGVCLMQMDVGLDTGAVFSTSRTALEETDTYHSLHDRLAQLGAELLTRDIKAIASGALQAHPQPDAGVCYAKKITSEEARIDWSQSATQIARKVRALYPSPGCHTVLDGRRLKILSARPADTGTSPTASAGTVIQALPDLLAVQCGSGVLHIDEVHLEGKRKMRVAEFLRGSAVSQGIRLQ